MIARVLDNIDRDPGTLCLISRYSVASHGYAQVGWQEHGSRFVTLAHRVAWVGTHGPIPENMTVDHLCHNRKCVNVGHMRLLPNFENARRNGPGDWPLDQCKNGHPASALRQYAQKRRCHLCRREEQRRYRAKLQLRVP